MRCGMCKKNDDSITVEHVKSCDGVGAGDVAVVTRGEPQWPASDKQITYVLGLQAERNLPDWWPTRTEADLRSMERDEVSADINQLKTFTKNAKSPDVYKPTMPAARYALNMPVTSNLGIGPLQWRFYQVEDGKGRWAGYKFLKRLIGSPGDYQKNPVPAGERDRIFRMIEDDPKKAMVDFGKQTKHCGRCLSPLTHERSRAAGYGEKCASVLGWPW